MGGRNKCCCDTCCTPIELPDETWSEYDTSCCIQKIIDVDPDDTWHYLCSDIIRECTQTHSVDLRIYRHLYPVVRYNYNCDDPNPIFCIPGGDCSIEGVTIPHCDNSVEECGLLSLYGTVNTKQKLVLKYKHLRDRITITKIKANCEPDNVEACKYLIIYDKIFDIYYGQVAFGSSTKTVSSVSGCCKVTGSSAVVSELTCEQAGDALTTHLEIVLSRSGLFDTIPDSIDFAKGDRATCVSYPSTLCLFPDFDGPVVCSTDTGMSTYSDATCNCGTEQVLCYVITVGTNSCTSEFGCIIREPYPSERHTKSICGITSGILPAYTITYDGTTCYQDCGDSLEPPGTFCPPSAASACRTPTGFISKVECENLTSATDCTDYVEQCLDLATENWTLTIYP